jgi:hypothetical protein
VVEIKERYGLEQGLNFTGTQAETAAELDTTNRNEKVDTFILVTDVCL